MCGLWWVGGVREVVRLDGHPVNQISASYITIVRTALPRRAWNIHKFPLKSTPTPTLTTTPLGYSIQNTLKPVDLYIISQTFT